jgi:hypothetical protein
LAGLILLGEERSFPALSKRQGLEGFLAVSTPVDDDAGAGGLLVVRLHRVPGRESHRQKGERALALARFSQPAAPTICAHGLSADMRPPSQAEIVAGFLTFSWFFVMSAAGHPSPPRGIYLEG